jgi:hypothetical protein
MSEYITLLGAEDVSRAGRQMASAADDMLRAASIISESNDLFIRRFDELVTRMEQTTSSPMTFEDLVAVMEKIKDG